MDVLDMLVGGTGRVDVQTGDAGSKYGRRDYGGNDVGFERRVGGCLLMRWVFEIR